MAETQQPASSSARRVPGGVGLWVAGGTTTLTAILIVLMILAVMGVMSARRPVCRGAATAGLAAASAAGHDAIPAELMPIYRAASARYGLGADGWLWLAAFNREETDFGHNLKRSSAGAIGWMQFMPATWRQYGVDGDNDGDRDPWNQTDGIFGAANYLRALGAPGDWAEAAFGYNHAGWYVEQVTAYHDRYLASSSATGPALVPIVDGGNPEAVEVDSSATAGGCGTEPAQSSAVDGLQLTRGERAWILAVGSAAAPASAPMVVKEMIVAGNQIEGKPYGHSGAGGTHGTPYTKVQDAYDCSSSIAFILFHAGQIRTATENWVSGTFASSFGTAGTSRWVTIRANGVHVYMYVAGLRWDTHRSSARDTGVTGIGWHTARRTDDADFTPRTLPATAL